jgi:hypothetical protein
MENSIMVPHHKDINFDMPEEINCDECGNHSGMVMKVKNICEDIRGIRKTLFGDDGKGGICADYLSQSSLKWFMGVFGASIVGVIIFFAMMWADNRETIKTLPVINQKIEALETGRVNNKESIIKLQEQLSNVKENTDTIIKMLARQNEKAMIK